MSYFKTLWEKNDAWIGCKEYNFLSVGQEHRRLPSACVGKKIVLFFFSSLSSERSKVSPLGTITAEVSGSSREWVHSYQHFGLVEASLSQIITSCILLKTQNGKWLFSVQRLHYRALLSQFFSKHSVHETIRWWKWDFKGFESSQGTVVESRLVVISLVLCSSGTDWYTVKTKK